MTDKLKSCPFCGGEADTEWHHGYWGVRCNNCYAEVTADGMNDAINLWNTRKPMDRIVEQLEEEAKRWYESGKEFKDEKELGVAGGFRYAIEIVKGVQNE